MTERELEAMACLVARLEDERDAARVDAARWREECHAARRLLEARADLPLRDTVGELVAVAASIPALHRLYRAVPPVGRVAVLARVAAAEERLAGLMAEAVAG